MWQTECLNHVKIQFITLNTSYQEICLFSLCWLISPSSIYLHSVGALLGSRSRFPLQKEATTKTNHFWKDCVGLYNALNLEERRICSAQTPDVIRILHLCGWDESSVKTMRNRQVDLLKPQYTVFRCCCRILCVTNRLLQLGTPSVKQT